jgi:hypothetical protein
VSAAGCAIAVLLASNMSAAVVRKIAMVKSPCRAARGPCWDIVTLLCQCRTLAAAPSGCYRWHNSGNPLPFSGSPALPPLCWLVFGRA